MLTRCLKVGLFYRQIRLKKPTKTTIRVYESVERATFDDFSIFNHNQIVRLRQKSERISDKYSSLIKQK